MKKITIGKIIDKFIELYKCAIANKYIRKPYSWTLYQTWKWADQMEQEREDKEEEVL